MNQPWTISQVEAHLVEAAFTCLREPDREAGWLTVKACWPNYPDDKNTAYALASAESEAVRAAIKAPLTSREITRRDIIEGWDKWIIGPLDRKLVFCAAFSLMGQARTYNDKDHPVSPKMNWDKVKALVGHLSGVAYTAETKTARRHYKNSLESIRRNLTAQDASGQMTFRATAGGGV